MKPSKCQLIEKVNRRDSAIKVIEGTNITMVDGFRVFGLFIGTPSACDKYMESEIEKTATLTEKLCKIAETSPQNAYSCKTKGVQNKLSFLTRTTPEASKKIDKIKKKKKNQLHPGFTGKNHITNEDRNLIAPLENSDPQIAETEQSLINRTSKLRERTSPF